MLQFHDSLEKKKKPFAPAKTGEVTMYNCGPTVYDYVHIGNLRAFVFADILRRFLEFRGYKVRQIMNITDVGHALLDADEGEDKLEASAKKQGRTPQEIAEFYTEAFMSDIDRLNIKRAELYPRASEHVDEMIAIIEKLLDSGMAYRVGKSVYFDVSAFDGYGKLSGNRIEGLDPGARVAVREEKKHPADFALWIHNPAHVMQWEAPWGTGYPGWHIECSAMAMKYLGETIDIHTGGEDNKFPHHECEIAQSEGATGKAFARYWLHVTHLMVEGEKMSKSKGNYHTLNDLLEKGSGAREIRYLLLSTHYRQSLNFTMQGLDSAKNALDRLDEFADIMRGAAIRPGTSGVFSRLFSRFGAVSGAANKAMEKFSAALDDDLNIAEALAVVFDFVRDMNDRHAKGELTEAGRTAALGLIDKVGGVLGFEFGQSLRDDEIPAEIMELVGKRDKARVARDFDEADRIRDELKDKGYAVGDTPEGRRIKKV